MEVQEYFESKKNIQAAILSILDNPDDINDEYQILIQLFNDMKIREDRNELITLFNLILNIANNHHRRPDFFNLIDQILSFFENDMKRHFSNLEIFNLFKSNKRITLFLFQSKIVVPDESVASLLSLFDNCNASQKDQRSEYLTYFYPEIRDFLDSESREKTENSIKNLDLNSTLFDENRKNGQNDNYICKLIQNDCIDEFVSYVNQTNYKLTSKIKPSIFETNNFLINRKCPSLIEYSAFCGSIQIFKYLFFNKVELTRSLWMYSIHGNNPDLIHFLEEKHVQINDLYYKEYVKESIKCHHNDIANYFINIFFNNEEKFESFISCIGIKHYNFSFYPDCMSNNLFNYFCELKCYSIIEKIINIPNLSINIKSALICYTKKGMFDIVDIIIRNKGIFDGAFDGCSLLKQILIPITAPFIGENAFARCSSLTQITIPSSVAVIRKYAFSKCSSLRKVLFDISSSLKLIDSFAFQGCKSLQEITIPSSVTKIGMCAFSECTSLNQILIPSSVTEIEGGAFMKCFSLEIISIISPDIKIGFHVFDGCAHVILNSKMTSIPAYMFSGCSSIKSIKIPSSITIIENHAFEKCSSLIQIEIPPSVTSIENNAFEGCSSLSSITIPSSVSKIGSGAFNGCSSMIRISIPNSVTSIKNHLFAGCVSLVDVEMPQTLTSIGNYAFSKCSSLCQVFIPSSVTWIGSNSFNGCTSLKQITIPSSVITIGKNAFPIKTDINKIK